MGDSIGLLTTRNSSVAPKTRRLIHGYLHPHCSPDPRAAVCRPSTMPSNLAGCTMLFTPATPTWRFSLHRCSAIALRCCWVQPPDDIGQARRASGHVARVVLAEEALHVVFANKISKITFRRLKFPTLFVCVCVCAYSCACALVACGGCGKTDGC